MNKSILHFSDIHFGGAQAPNWAEALLAEINRVNPTVVAVSGDLTQRARTAQFRQARTFLDRIKAPVIVVPGNHDVPLWNVFDRFLSPLEKYRRWVTDDLNPVYFDDGLAIMGIDTTLSFTIKGGEIDEADLGVVRERLCELPSGLCKVIVAHHPFAQPPGFEHEETVAGLDPALKLFEGCNVEVILTGHLHQSFVASSKDIYPHLERGILLVQAGTVASLRGRGEEKLKNSYNLIEVTEQEINVTSFIYSDRRAAFITQAVHTWTRHTRSVLHAKVVPEQG